MYLLKKITTCIMVAALAAPLARGMDASLALTTLPLGAMAPKESEQATLTASYRFAGIIRPKYAHDYICFVKSFADKENARELLAVFDCKGRSEFFIVDATDLLFSPCVVESSFYLRTSLKEASYHMRRTPKHDVFQYQDCHQNPLLVFLETDHNVIALLSFVSNNYDSWRTIRLPRNKNFSLFLTNQQELMLQETWPKQRTLKIAVHWNPEQSPPRGEETGIGYQETASDQVPAAKDEGLVVSSEQQRLDGLWLSGDIFDLDTCPKEYNHHIRTYNFQTGKVVLKDISCYHKTPSGAYYLGHDGLVSIWVPKNCCDI